MANRMPGEIWSIRQQKDWNVGLSRKNNTRLSTATCTSSAKSMLLVAASKNANIRVVQTGQLAPFPLRKRKQSVHASTIILIVQVCQHQVLLGL